MYQEFVSRFKQGYRTIKFPEGKPPLLPPHFRGRLLFALDKCEAGCRICAEVCPVGAIDVENKSLDMGKCLFCTDCMTACPREAISFSEDYRLAVRRREDLQVTAEQMEIRLATELDRRLKKLFGRSLKLRQVSAGGCNACEADVNVLCTIGWDLGRFGIQFVASPRHADGLLITGPVTKNMELALKKTWEAVPEPKIVIVVGACAIGGGPYRGHEQVNDGAGFLLPVDLYIPGCPPHPLTILDGLLRLVGRIKGRQKK
ncbi:MAG TPA: hydrogenase [Proteobacteria bacterium]|nr:hydrogenase [Pseudomonadota bacterium]